jgi:23S rRNA (uracil1939-C5)-methyltransferase
LETILDFMDQYHITAYQEKQHKGLVRHILIRVGKHTGQVMVCLVVNGEKLPQSDQLVKRLLDVNPRITSICLNQNTEKTNRIMGTQGDVLYGKSYIEDTIGGILYRISPLSFYQVNPEQTEKLYNTVLEYADLSGGEVVWDLYCGIGTISLFLAGKAAKVCGVEIVPQAVEDARCNARINGFRHVEFFEGAAENVVPEQYEKSGGALHADVVTIDPPRKGCDEKLLETIIHMRPQKIVYVSCDPATLARDLKYLTGHGYQLRRVRACDMFGHSAHVETIVLLVNIDVR